MFKAFNCVIDDRSLFSRWSHAGGVDYKSRTDALRSDLSAFVNRKEIDGTALAKTWFPAQPVDVFISHSHADESLAIGLVGFFRSLGVSCFVDSLVWGNSAELLRTIDNKFCRSTSGGTYDYVKRNYSTSHVHLMLATALAQMIDKAECVIFLNTPSSIDVSSSSVAGKEVTASPWIYHELSVLSWIASRQPVRTQGRMVEASSMENLRLVYEAPLSSLEPLSGAQLLEIGRNNGRGSAVLDSIYNIRGR